MTDNRVDFAISYAGEDKKIAKEISIRLVELGFNVFFGENERHLLAGTDGETFFEQLFTNAKEVIVLISKHYKRKDWPRFEWDIIKKRDFANRFIPVRLDDSPILGLPSSVIYIEFTNDSYDEIIKSCVYKLLMFEKDIGIHRPTEYEKILDLIINDSRGATAKAYQLVKDQRTRSPLSDCAVPQGNFPPAYQVKLIERYDFSVIKRLSAKIVVPSKLSREELRFNLEHCTATLFNEHKPDALMVFAYIDSDNLDLDSQFNAGHIIFAPFGKWDKAQDGVAYNIPTEEFKFSITYSENYFLNS
jgi:hypothetical protein